MVIVGLRGVAVTRRVGGLRGMGLGRGPPRFAQNDLFPLIAGLTYKQCSLSLSKVFSLGDKLINLLICRA